MGAAVFKNKLYLAGGRDSGGANYPDFFALTEPKVDVYDFATETWSTMREDFPAPRAGASVVIYGGSMWVAGGEGSGKAWDDVEILSGSRLGSRFQAGPKMPHPRHGFGMVSCNGVLWVAGGAGTEGGGASQTMLDAYHTGKKPKACRISVTGTSKPSTLPSTSPTPVPSPSASISASPSASTALPSRSPNSIPTAEATDAPQPTPVTEVVPEPTSPPASQPTPVSVPVAEDVDEVSATPGTSTLSSKTPEENPQPPSPPYFDDTNDTPIPTSISTETSPEPSYDPSPSIDVDTPVSDEETVDESPDSFLIAGINDIFHGNDDGNKGVSEDKENDAGMSGVDLEPKKNDGGGSALSLGEDDEPLYPGESGGEINDEFANTFLSPSMMPTPDVPIPVLNFSLDDVPTLTSLMDETFIELETPEPGLEGVPVEVDDSESAEKPCFPASATVQLENGSIKKMSDLVVGDRVSVGKNQFSEVFMFTHKLSSVQYDFVQLETASGNALRLTDGHFLPINGEYLPAKHASVGDELILADGSVSDIVSISSVQDYGLFNPQTTHGDIVVDGIQASTYTTAVSPNMAHALLAPLRTICSRFGMEMRFLESGAESVARFTSIAA